MSNFVVELWEAIFTPGPTPTLLKAANASFAALQLVLLLLLVATYNIHCLVLSLICAGLWVSINWFAAELAAVQREQAQREEAEKKKEEEEEDGGSTTEVETVVKDEEAKSSVVDTLDVKGDVTRRGGAQAQTQTQTQSSASTEDEWEKVSEAENEKDK